MADDWFEADNGFVMCRHCFDMGNEFDVCIGASSNPEWKESLKEWTHFINGNRVCKQCGKEMKFFHNVVWFCKPCFRGEPEPCPKCGNELNHGMDPCEEGNYLHCDCGFHQNIQDIT